MLLTEYLSRPGEVVKLAREIEVAPAVVSQWKNGVRNVPADRCPSIERATEGAVRCEDLRPDVDWAYLRGTDCAESPTERAVECGASDSIHPADRRDPPCGGRRSTNGHTDKAD